MKIRRFSLILSVRAVRFSLLACALMISAIAISGYGQVSLSTGGIQGTVTDPSGAVVPGARVVLTEPSTGRTQTTQTGSSGLYSFGTLSPGDYRIHIEASGFGQLNETVTVQVGNVANGNVRLALAGNTEIVNVNAAAVTL